MARSQRSRCYLRPLGRASKTLVDLLSQFTGRYVRDRTGLTGRYDFDMK
jgi:uncharacterized protein (TIGR03435 family)